MKALIPCALVALLLPAAVLADVKTDLAKCAAITDGAKRLECFDGVAKAQGATPQRTSSSGGGKWRVTEEVSPIDDSRNVILTLQSEEPIRTRFSAQNPTLVLRCSENKTEAYIAWNTFITTGDVQMLLRFGKESARSYTLSTSTDHKAVFFGRGFAPITFIRKALEHETVLAQVTPHSESPVMATFDLRGLADAVKPLQEACNWQ